MIFEQDDFIDMPKTAQVLYFHLLLRSDADESLINNPKAIMRMIGANEDDMRILLAKGFVSYVDDTVMHVEM